MHKNSCFAIVTPYYKEPRATIERCVESVRRQTVAADHFLVADGFPQSWLDDVGVNHIRLRHAHRDFGDTPRAIGALVAISQRYKCIGFLDADNWYEDDYVDVCSTPANSVAPEPIDLVIAKRRMVRMDGTPTTYPEESGHVDTSCYWFLEGAFHLLHYWLTIPGELAPIGDRVFYQMIRSRKLSVREAPKITVNYTCTVQEIYHALGERPPPGTKPGPDFEAIRKWLLGLDGVNRRLVAERCGIDLVPMLARRNAERSEALALTRNSPCPCGSGKKYKHCHGALRSVEAKERLQ
jgi:hypothetical protein